MLMRTIREPMRILSISMACLATLPVLGQTDSSGSALSFNGANSYVSIPTTGSLTGTFTVEMWFYPGSTNLLASAFLHETNQSLTVVLLNSGSSPLSTTIALPSQPPGLSQLRVFTSSDSAYWQAATVPVAGGSITVSLPGYGVATLYGTSPATLTARLAGPDTVVLSWPRANAGFALQFASSLVPPVVWATDTNSVSLSGGLGTVIEPIVSRGRFYRLTFDY